MRGAERDLRTLFCSLIRSEIARVRLTAERVSGPLTDNAAYMLGLADRREHARGHLPRAGIAGVDDDRAQPALGGAPGARQADRAATGALEDVRGDARERVAEAKRLAAGAAIETEQRELLEVVADGVVERYS